MHEPSRYRALVREMKSGEGRVPELLIDEARQLKDPYYVSLTLFSLSMDKQLNLQQAFTIASEALVIASGVPRLWRRAELLTILTKKASSWRGNEPSDERKNMLDKLLYAVVSMPNGKELLDTIDGCASRFECHRLAPLLSRALTNSGFELSSAKIVIRRWIQHCDTMRAVEEIMVVLGTAGDRILQAKLIGYMSFQCRKLEQCYSGTQMLFHHAIESALKADGTQRLDALQYLVKLASTAEEYMHFRDAANHLDTPAEKIRLLTTLGGCVDKAGLQTMAIELFKEAWRLSSSVTDSYSRATFRYNIAQGFAQCGQREIAQQVYIAALEDSDDNMKFRDKLYASSSEYGISLPGLPKTRDQRKHMVSEDMEMFAEKESIHTHHVLALYDTYEGAITSVHLRAIARAVPLCIAFDIDLVLMGFPADNLHELARRVVAETNIGKGGAYLDVLIQQKRVMFVKCTRHDPPEDWSILGLPVATTSRPDKEKCKGLREVIRLATSEHPLHRACFIMGLGRKGLPHSLLHAVTYHLELTGRGVSLETCTAMGVIAQQIYDAEHCIQME